jgi:hypothetical protein
MELDWCRNQALDPHECHYHGLYKPDNEPFWRFGYGKALYDRFTSEFGCIGIKLSLFSFYEDLQHIDNHTRAALVQLDGTLVSGGDWLDGNETVKIWDTKTWLTFDEWTRLTTMDGHDGVKKPKS